ncbi:MAG: protein phosphatase 2C domain-containing protein [bacterium]
MEKKWIYSYGELVGKSHGPRNIPCQDKALCRFDNGVHVAVVSDGCGSSDISQYGSLVTTEALCQLFIDRFDEIYDDEILSSRKTIVNEIAKSLIKYIEENNDIFDEYKVTHKEKYEAFIARRSEREFDLDCLNATAMFVAEKDGKFILGQIGDGIIGAVIDNKIKIVMEEKKDGEVNGTIYPANIYNLAQIDERWYATSQFQLKKPKNANLNGFILMTDGVDGLIDQRVAFQKKFAAGAGKLIKNTIKAESFEEAQKSLNEELLPRLVEFSKARDDCGLALLITDSCEIDDDGYVVTHYERPVTKDEDEDEEFDDHFRIEGLENIDEQSEEELLELEKLEKVYEKNNAELLTSLKKVISAKEAKAFYDKVQAYFETQSKFKVTEVLEYYINVLENLDEHRTFSHELTEKAYRNMTFVYLFDDKITSLSKNKITRSE